MNLLEKLEQKAYDEKLQVDYIDFNSNRIRGLYCDGSIALSTNLPTTALKADVLAEELGHHYTTVGNILDIDSTANRKQERTARLWAYNERLGLNGIIKAFKAQCTTAYEIAEYLDVSEEFLKEALECYKQIYGNGVMVDKYFLQFEPNLQIYTYHAVTYD